MKKCVLLVLVLLGTGFALADEAAPPAPDPNAPQTQAKEQAKAEPASEARPQSETSDAKSAAVDETQATNEEGTGNEAPGGEAQEQKQQGPKVISGMSILGNQEAPKSLVIVPWKTSEIGDAIGFSTMLDDSRQPIDKEVFMRELSYYQIRSKTTP